VTEDAGAAGPDESAETEPDARFTLANQRTFLSWSRTALALVAAGLGIVQLLPPFPGVPWGRRVIGVPLIVLGAVTAAAAYLEWTRTQRALRRGEALPRSVLPLILAATIGIVAAAAAAVALVSATR
jgi:putative membrane protein